MQYTYDSVTFDCSTDLLGAGGDVKGGFCLESVLHSLLGDVSASAHVFVRAVRAGANEANFDFIWPAILFSVGAC